MAGYGDVYVAPVPTYDKLRGTWQSVMPDRPYWLTCGADYAVSRAAYVLSDVSDDDEDELSEEEAEDSAP